MARPSELTQEHINAIADELTKQGIKPSPNTVREKLGTGSYTTIKTLLEQWRLQAQQEETVLVPELPEFALHDLEKLHRQLYLHNHKLLEHEREQLHTDRLELESDRQELLAEIDRLEKQLAALVIQLEQKDHNLTVLQAHLDQQNQASQQQAIELAILKERENQFQQRLIQAEQTQAQQAAQIAELIKQLSLTNLKPKEV